MSTLSRTIGNLSDAQSLELAQAIKQIDAAGDLSKFTESQKQDLIKTIIAEHSDTASKNFSDYQRSSDNINHLLYYYTRSKDVKNLQQNILSRESINAENAIHDKELAKRQFEINEWSAANKGETIFIMQLLLMAVTFTVFMLFLNRMGAVPTPVFIFVTAVIFIAFILTFVIRYQYTTYSRDTRYWNRKRQTPMIDQVLPDSCASAALQASISNIQNNLATTAERVGDTAENVFDRIGAGFNAAFA